MFVKQEEKGGIGSEAERYRYDGVHHTAHRHHESATGEAYDKPTGC
jgi:hypothetical protein